MWQTILHVVHVVTALSLVGLVLIQHGKGADAGAAFGSGASATVFGSRGSGSFLTRATTFLAVMFFATSLTLAMLARQYKEPGSVMESFGQMTQPKATETAPETQLAVDDDVPVVPGRLERAVTDVPEVPDEAPRNSQP